MKLWIALWSLWSTTAAVGMQDPQTPPDLAAAGAREKMACAPMSLPAPPLDGIFVMGSATPGRLLFGPGDVVVVSAGVRQGLKRGQTFFVRRQIRDKFTPASIDFTPISIHTVGWLTIVDARDDLSVAQVNHACDAITQGDYLEPYVAPALPSPAAAGAPDYEHPGRVVMADEKRQTGAAGDMMLINRGADHDVRAGQRLTIFRETMNGLGPVLEVGHATVLSVRPLTSLIRIEDTREPVFIGDLAAIHRIR